MIKLQAAYGRPVCQQQGDQGKEDHGAEGADGPTKLVVKTGGGLHFSAVANAAEVSTRPALWKNYQ